MQFHPELNIFDVGLMVKAFGAEINPRALFEQSPEKIMLEARERCEQQWTLISGLLDRLIQ